MKTILILGLFYYSVLGSRIESDDFCLNSGNDRCTEEGTFTFNDFNEYVYLRFKEDFGGNSIKYHFTSDEGIFDVFLMDENNFKNHFSNNKGTFNTYQEYSTTNTRDFSVDLKDNMSKPTLQPRIWYYLVIRSRVLTNNVDYNVDLNLNDTAWVISLSILGVICIIGLVLTCMWIRHR